MSKPKEEPLRSSIRLGHGEANLSNAKNKRRKGEVKSKLSTLGLVLIVSGLIFGGCGPGLAQPTAVPPTPTPIPPTPTPAPPTPDEYEGWKTYTSEHGYSLRYPADCTFGPMPGYCKEKPPEERPPECLCFLNAEDPDRVFLQAFTGEKEDLKGATFAVDRTVFRPPPGTDLIEYVREKFPHYEEIPNEPNVKVGPIPAVRLYTPRSPMAPSYEEIFFIKDDKFFRINMLDVDEEVNRELYDGISSALEISVETQ